MASEIQVTSEQLRRKAEELNEMNEKFLSARNELIEQESALRGGFEGETSDAFHTAFTRDVTQMQNFYNAIVVYVRNLLQIAANYESAENANTATARERKY